MKITPIICGLGMLCFLIAMIATVSWDVNSAVNSKAGFRDAQNKIQISNVFEGLGVGCFVIAFFTYIFEVNESSNNKQNYNNFYGSHISELEEDEFGRRRIRNQDIGNPQQIQRRKSSKANIFNTDVCPKCKGVMIKTRYGYQCKQCGYSDASKDYIS